MANGVLKNHANVFILHRTCTMAHVTALPSIFWKIIEVLQYALTLEMLL
jgi:hypothetical protein